MSLDKLLAENLIRFRAMNLDKLEEQGPKSAQSVTQSQTDRSKSIYKNTDMVFDNDYLKTSKNLQLRITVGVPPNNPDPINPNYETQISELKAHPAYKSLLTKMSEENSAETQMKIFYYRLTQERRLKFLDQALEFFRSFTKKRKLAKALEADPNYTGVDKLYNFDVDLNADAKVQKFKIEQEDDPVDEIKFQGIDIPLDVVGATTYVDMSTQPGPALQSAIEAWTKQVADTLAAAKQLNPKAVATCSNIEIASSCSRLRNSTNITWLQLSQGRAVEVQKILIGKLKELGVLFKPDMVRVLRGGTNSTADGTSGPNPGKINGTQFTISETGAKNSVLKATKQNINMFGTPHTTREEYDQYKFCKASVKIIIKADDVLVNKIPLQPQYTYSRGYTLELAPRYYSKPIGKLKPKRSAYKGGGSSTKYKPIKNKTSNKAKKVRSQMTKCFEFGSGFGG